MAWSDAGQRLEALPTAGTGCNFVISDCPALSTPATIAGRCRYQSLIASGMIYVHISFSFGDVGAGHGRKRRGPRVQRPDDPRALSRQGAAAGLAGPPRAQGALSRRPAYG